METLRLGKSELIVGRLAFGALPIQRVDADTASAILHRALDGGVTFFDTARFYTDSEEKLGRAFSGMRQKVCLASKSMGETGAAIEADLAVTLKDMRTDYLDLYQSHNPSTVPQPGDGTGRYETLAGLKKSGVIRAIGITNHSLERARQAVASGLYDTVQFPFSLLSTEDEQALAQACRDNDIGFLAMKALGGGLIRNVPAAFTFTRRFDNVLPLWGIQSMTELEEFLRLDAAPPVWNADMKEAVEKERAALGKSFCRGCGYCLPCPMNIQIPNVARLSLLLRRSPWQQYAEPKWQDFMRTAKACIECGDCAGRCPYQLDTPSLVKENTAEYEDFMRQKGIQLQM